VGHSTSPLSSKNSTPMHRDFLRLSKVFAPLRLRRATSDVNLVMVFSHLDLERVKTWRSEVEFLVAAITAKVKTSSG
jgi:hypothetical protein